MASTPRKFARCWSISLSWRSTRTAPTTPTTIDIAHRRLSLSKLAQAGRNAKKSGAKKKRKGGVTLLEDAGAAELVELFGELEFVVMLEDDERVGGEKIGGGEKFEGTGVVDVGGVGGIDEYEIERRRGRSVAGGKFLEGGEGVGGEDGGAGGDLEGVEILADEFCGGRVIFDKGYIRGAAAEGFDAY